MWAPHASTSVLTKRQSEGFLCTQKKRQCEDGTESDLKMLVLKIGVMWPQGKEGRKLLDPGRGRGQVLPYTLWRQCSLADIPSFQPSDTDIGLSVSRTVREN